MPFWKICMLISFCKSGKTYCKRQMYRGYLRSLEHFRILRKNMKAIEPDKFSYIVKRTKVQIYFRLRKKPYFGQELTI